MASKDPTKQPIVLLKSAFGTIAANPVILFPFTIIAFVQILILEIIFFAPRYPLSIFFRPIIQRIQGEIFLHYPFNFTLMNKWFQSVQIPIFVLLSSLLIGVAVAIIDFINKDKKIEMKEVFKRVLPLYIHLVVYGVIAVLCIIGLGKLYGLLIKRALIIRSTTGIFFFIKKAVLILAPYFNLFFAVLVSTLLAFVMPIIVLEKKNVFTALLRNFKMISKTFWFVLVVIVLPALLYLPVLLLKSNTRLFQDILPPEGWGFILILGILLTLFIDAVQYTAITSYYLLKKESQ